MTKHTDSSAPNVPEVTRLSGEQAEERAAREGRKFGEHDEPLSRPDGHNPYWCGGDMAGQCCFDDPCWSCISFLHEAAENALTECSRLASRVEELEKVLKPLIEIAKGYRVYAYDTDFLNGTIAAAERVLTV